MNSRVLAFAVIVLAAVVAAGTGGYLAMRRAAPAEEAGLAPAGTPPTASAVGEGVPVAETEGVVEPRAGPEAAEAGFAAVPESARSGQGPAVGSATQAQRAGRGASAPAGGLAPGSSPSSTKSRVAARPLERPRAGATRSPSERAAEVIPPVVPVETPPASPVEVERIPPPPVKQFEEVVIPGDAVIGVQLDRTISSEAARVEDRIEGRVTRDVRAGGLVAIPAGSRVQGVVTLVERGGKVKERARLGVRFHTVVLADGTRVPIQTETVYREGESPTGESAAKIGGAAVGGAILGAIIGGSKGAAIGGSVGAAGGTAAVLAGARNPATLPAGTTVTVRLTAPATVTVEKDY